MCKWFIYLLFIPVSTALAVDNKTQNRLTLDQAIINVLEHNPLLKAADFEANAAAANIRAAQLSPAFRTSIEFENFAGTGAYSGTDAIESTLSLSKVLELGDKAKIRGNLANNKAMLLRNKQDAKRLDILAETAKRFIHVVTDQQRLIIAKDSLALANNTKKVVEQRIKAGKTPNAELRRAKITLARKEIELEHAEHELVTSRLKLVTLWGETQTTFTTAEANLFKIEPTIPFDELEQRLKSNPDLVRFATEKRLAATGIQLARSASRSDIEITGGLRHFNLTDDSGFVLSLNIPLGSSSRSKSKIEEAEMMSLREPHIFEQRRLELYATLFEVHQEIKHAIDAVTTLRETIIPQAKLALKDYEKGYKAGRYSFLELSEAQNTLLDSRLESVMAAADYHQYRIEIDRLTGAGLSTGVNP